MDAYLNLGMVLQIIKEYQKANLAFKRLLQVAWSTDNYQMEMRAYEMMGLQYFYLGDIPKAEFYLKRSLFGKSEAKTNQTRHLATSEYRKAMEWADNNSSCDT